MISQEFLDMLRCPLAPTSRLRLEGGRQENDRLVCERCALHFAIKDGFPILVVEEAELPAGCATIGQLPCQREAKAETRT
jgi:uncharacterized protein YbaR (Trm112 family)